MTFHDFLTWFDGWSENIEERPSEKQWQRLKAKLAEVRQSDQTQTPSRKPKPEPPMTEAKWKAKYQSVLIDDGYDPESAKDAMAGIVVDLKADPHTEARKFISGTKH